MLTRLARFSYRRRRYVLAIWVLALVGMTVFTQTVGPSFSQDFRMNGYDSQEAADLLKERFPDWSGLPGDIIFQSDTGIDDPEVVTKMTALFAEIRELPQVTSVRSPFEPDGAQQISPVAPIAFATVQFDAETIKDVPAATMDAIRSKVDLARSEGLQIELGGQIFEENAPPGTTELIGLTAAVIILILTFGSILAMGLPIGTALFGVGVGIGAVGAVSYLTTVPDFALELGSMIGIGVGIDYALFIVTRYRQGLGDGLAPESATITAIDTAGRAVLFAGLTVVISMAGMLLIDIRFIQGLGVGCMVVVAITMLASLTMLPALLGFVGYNIDKFKIPGLDGGVTTGESTPWYRWSRVIQRRPWPALIIGLVIMGVLAYPITDMRLGSADEGSMPTSTTSRRAFDMKVKGFGPGADAPFLMAVNLGPGTSPEVLSPLLGQLMEIPGVAGVTPPIPNDDGDVAVFSLIPTTAAPDKATTELLNNLREDVIPPFEKESGVTIHIGGMTAAFDDLAANLQTRLPAFIGAVLVMAFLLLMLVFRSILVPLKAVFLNLLSIGAAYGFIVAVFQWGWGGSLLGLTGGGPIESFIPMMMFAILFGLSMDYEVFLLSRIKEEYDRTGNNEVAVADGLSATARVITAAAAIMIMVFGSFVLSDTRVVKMFGLGLAVAVLLDATLVRMVLVPSSMELMGKANWWFPRWLEWLPTIHVEGSSVSAGDSSTGIGYEIHDTNQRQSTSPPTRSQTNGQGEDDLIADRDSTSIQ